MSEYEEILSDLHQFGSFQRRVFILVSLFDLPSAWSMILPVFIGGNPGWKCPVAGNYTDDKNISSKGLNFTINTCSADDSICEGLSFNKDLTSILTEVMSVYNRLQSSAIMSFWLSVVEDKAISIMSEYEEILRDLHQFGSFQRRVFILVSLFDLPSAWSMILPVFVGANPGWKCPVAGNYTDGKNISSKSFNFSADTCSTDGSICEGLSFNKDFTSILTEMHSLFHLSETC
ncbi:hypothetical protein KUTeg_018523 [Tegillarca granosa]|uniref:Uncharacterized protein n=1 Tax=Tegillarca granosa TaxID=220873 RepID=A0ABQ9EID5_TEGGR|nr:hypothetical protein KUTeg_018523 [Tegillarca granosa]